jgi:LPPG:FO 2-phospho-L-lactate transferase
VIVALAGGVGGAKLADGLASLLGRNLAVVVNTGDDFEHLGLHISPDLDTVMYTLAGIANPETGWGIANESWSFLKQVTYLGGPGWFQLGDRDLATHVLRTERLRQGERLTSITLDFCRQLGIAAFVLPMSDEPIRTIVDTAEGPLPFQEYFVARHCEVPVRGFRFQGSAQAKVTSDVRYKLNDIDLKAIVVCPSNPYVSIDPILSVPGLRQLIQARSVPVVAVSPIIGSAAVKGPAAKIMQELGFDVSSTSIAARYRGLIHGLIIDVTDAALQPTIEAMGIKACVVPTLMRSAEDRRVLGKVCIEFASAIAQSVGRQDDTTHHYSV